MFETRRNRRKFVGCLVTALYITRGDCSDSRHHNPGQSGRSGLRTLISRQRLDPLTENLRPVEDEKYWEEYLGAVDSLAMIQPTNEPTTPAPTLQGLSSPTASPSIDPLHVTSEPTHRCQVDLDLRCLYGAAGSSCADISPKTQLMCSCSNCVTELMFTFTGKACGGYDGCQDIGGFSTEPSKMMISSAYDPTKVLFLETLQVDSPVVVSSSDGSCLPGALDVRVTDGNGEEITQVISIDSSCDDAGLQLLQSYGSLDFVGYSCGGDDVHRCSVDVLFEVESCNIGSSNQSLVSFTFDLNGRAIDFLASGIPSNGLVLGSNECIKSSHADVMEICRTSEYHAKAFVGAKNVGTNVNSCRDFVESKFGWEIPTVRSSTANPTHTPSATPSHTPTILPYTWSPTDVTSSNCHTKVSVECVSNNDDEVNCNDIEEETKFVCLCPECPKELIFKYVGDKCDDSDEEGAASCLDKSIGIYSPARILIFDNDNVNNILYEGIGQTGSFIHLRDGNEGCLPSVLNVTISSNEKAATFIQTQTINTHCNESSTLTLTKSYGALEFLGYSCDSKDAHNCHENVYYTASACNEHGSNKLILFEMGLELNGFSENLLGETAPRTLNPGECLQYAVPSSVERCIGADYSARLIVDSAQEGDGALCTDTNETFFTLPTGIARSSFQDSHNSSLLDDTNSPPLEETTQTDSIRGDGRSVCNIKVGIDCQVIDGLNTTNCNELYPSRARECRGDDYIVESLTFNYTGRLCSSDNLPDHCTDFRADERDEVFISIRGHSSEFYFQGNVSLGDIIHVKKPIELVEVLVHSLHFNDPAWNKGEQHLQRVMLRPSCQSSTRSPTLRLGGDYGSLNLVSIQTNILGLQSLYADVEIKYSITNPSEFASAALQSAVISSSLTNRLGEQQISRSADDGVVWIPNLKTATLLVERRRLNLVEEYDQAHVFAIRGVASGNRLSGSMGEDLQTVCSDMGTLFFRIHDNGVVAWR